jgi:hypothetical protein
LLKKGGDVLNKKALIAIFTLLAVAMLATPLVGTAQACRRRKSQAFEATFELRNPESTPYSGGYTPSASTVYWGPQDDAWINPSLNPDGYRYSLAKGLIAWGTIDCGPLGIGRMTLTQKSSFTNHETSMGYVIATYYIEFDGMHGDYVGTLTGTFFKKTWVEFPMFYSEGKGAIFKGTGNLEGIKITANVDIEINLTVQPLIVYGELTGRIWGL